MLEDGPILILCPATLTLQWQVELSDKLGIPSAVWSSTKKVWLDHRGGDIGVLAAFAWFFALIDAYRQALAKCRRLARALGIDAVMTKHRLDALVAPTGSPPSLTDLANGDYGFSGTSTFPAVAGYPHVTVPAGYHFGLPVGISFFGRAFSEPTLIRIAYAYEQATRHRTPPRFLPTAALSQM